MTDVRPKVFPARAGMILNRDQSAGCVTSIPRESGDDPPKNGWDDPPEMYSPRERG